MKHAPNHTSGVLVTFLAAVDQIVLLLLLLFLLFEPGFSVKPWLS